MIEYIKAVSGENYAQAAMLFREYAAWLNIDLSFQHFSEELSSLQSMYSEPLGAIILAKAAGEYAGCIAVRKFEERIAELKRMYVRPSQRGKGLGDALLRVALEKARELGYQKIRLDTLSNMAPAIALYKKYGFHEIAAYYHNPEQNVVYFEKEL